MRFLSSLLTLMLISYTCLSLVAQAPFCPDPVNLSQGKYATQSSRKASGYASLAVDGTLTGGNPWRGEIQHTTNQAQPWWQVDLGSVANLSEILIYNRTDCCQSRLRDFVILLSEEAFPSDNSLNELRDLPSIHALSYQGSTQDLYRFPTELAARYVRIQLRGSNSLHMAEVQVMGCPIESEPPTVEERFPPVETSSDLQALLDCSPQNIPAITPLTPSQDQNYIRTIQYRARGTGNFAEAEKVQQVTYYDGLGRPIQSIDGQGTPQGNDLLTPVTYDAWGRPSVAYLPFTPTASLGSISGAYRQINSPKTEAQQFYVGLPSLSGRPEEIKPWSVTEFEASPLNRVIEQGAPGDAWQPEAAPGQQGSGEHTQVSAYRTNSQAVPGFDPTRLNSSYLPITPNFYPANSLHILHSYDENGALTETATDQLGRKLYSSVQVGESYRLPPLQSDSFATTYFVYDIHSNVRYVIQPEGWKRIRRFGLYEAVIQDFCFQYLYDDRQRIRRKRVPGGDWVDLVYDELDRVVATQDGMLREKGHWLVTHYDYLGRPIRTGICTQVDTRQELEDLISYNQVPYESLKDSKDDYSTYLDPQVRELHSLTFYDSYDFLPDPSFSFQPEAQIGFLTRPGDTPEPYRRAESSKGQVTGVRVFVLAPAAGMPTSLLTVTYYDKYGREIQTIAENHLGGKELVANRYNFAGELIESVLFHNWKSSNQQRIHKVYTYDHRGRLERILQQINEDKAVALVENQYDEIGQLIEKNLGASACQDPLQSVDYQYNLRGWLTRINSPLDPTEDPSPDGFSLILRYNEGAHPLYNGNIASLSWKNEAIDRHWRRYNFRYDQMNRLTKADYQGLLSEAYDVPAIRYDLNGNIRTLHRKGKVGPTAFGDLDKLTYTYLGNRLNTLTEAAQRQILTDIDHFSTRSNGSAYRYDANGNITYDPHKGITYTYNHLNKPIRAEFRNNSFINWIYSADGTKLQEAYSGDSSATHDYVGGFFYVQKGSSDRQLQHLIHEEGRALKLGNRFRYEFDLKDHLGNVRLSFTDKNGNGTLEKGEVLSAAAYYPFGMKMGGFSYQQGTEKRLGYNGKEWHQELGLGLYDYGARMYDPSVGRWNGVDALAEDPIQLQYSPYSYTFNNPINLIDPDGNKPCPPGVPCENPLPNMERIRVNRASNLGPGYVRNNGNRFHKGHDLYAPVGMNVRSVMDGKVFSVGRTPSYGNYVTIQHDVKEKEISPKTGKLVEITRDTYYSFYAHLSSTEVMEGELVAAGSKIGEVGTTGNADGLSGDDEHLHFEYGSERRTDNPNLLTKNGQIDPNIVYKDVRFFTMASKEKNYNKSSVMKAEYDENRRLLRVIHQKFISSKKAGPDHTWDINKE